MASIWDNLPDEPSQTPSSGASGSPSSQPSIWDDLPDKPQADTSQMGKFNGTPVWQDAKEAIPFSGMIDQTKQGYNTGVKLLGNNIAGKGVGAIFGGALGLGTVLNPLSKGIDMAPKIVQSLGSLSGGDVPNAARDITGSNAIKSAAIAPNLDSGIPAIDIPINTLINNWNEIAKQPFLLSALEPGSFKTGAQSALDRSGAALRDMRANREASINASKPLQMGPEVGSPLVNTKVAPNPEGTHFVEPGSILKPDEEMLLSRSAPALGASRNVLKTSGKIKNGYMEAFRVDPQNTGSVGGTLQVIADNAPDIYKKYLDYGRNAPEVVLDTEPIRVSLRESIGEAPTADHVSNVTKEAAAYPDKMTLPGLIQKLEQINQRLGPLIQRGETGAEYATLMIQSQAIRSIIDPAIEKIGGKQASSLRTTYGDMTELAKSLGKTAQKLDRNILPNQRGSFNDLVGVGEMMTAGIHSLHGGLNPVTAALLIDGALRKAKGSQKAFWTDANKMMDRLNVKLNKRIGRSNVQTPEGFLPERSMEQLKAYRQQQEALQRRQQQMQGVIQSIQSGARNPRIPYVGPGVGESMEMGEAPNRPPYAQRYTQSTQAPKTWEQVQQEAMKAQQESLKAQQEAIQRRQKQIQGVIQSMQGSGNPRIPYVGPGVGEALQMGESPNRPPYIQYPVD